LSTRDRNTDKGCVEMFFGGGIVKKTDLDWSPAGEEERLRRALAK
jgi:hypothetical protein